MASEDRAGTSGEEQLGPPPPVRRRTVLVIAVALAIVAGAGTAWRLAGHHDHPAIVTTTAAAAPEPATRAAMPVPTATDALLPGTNTAEKADSSSVSYSTQMVNGTGVTLRLTGPIRLLGPGGQPVPHTRARVVAGSDPWGGTTLISIAPHATATLLIDASVDCTRDAAELAWPARYPRIVIPLAGFDTPWSMPFDEVVAASDPQGNFLSDSCRSHNRPGADR